MNRQVVLARRPTGIPEAADFAFAKVPIPSLADGEVLIENHFLSVEPAMRGWLADKSGYSKPINVGEVMRSLATGRVVATRHEGYAVGEFVTGWFGWQDTAKVRDEDIVRKIGETDLPLSLSLGLLGLNGLAAYLGLTIAGEPRAGDTVVVSTAAGAVGSAGGQIAKILGCRAVGIAGSKAKVKICLDAFGYDAAFDYSADDLPTCLSLSCPEGIDVYFDNTAGPISDAVRANLAIGARIVICGTASVASWDPQPQGPRVERDLLTKRARMQGFLAFDHREKSAAAIAKLAGWVRAGKLAWREDILEGLEACPGAIAGLYRGENLGKRIIRLR